MKHLKYLLLICLAAAAACSKDKTEDPTSARRCRRPKP